MGRYVASQTSIHFTLKLAALSLIVNTACNGCVNVSVWYFAISILLLLLLL